MIGRALRSMGRVPLVILWAVAGVVAMTLITIGVWQFSPRIAYIVVGAMVLILVIGAAYEPSNSRNS